MGHFIHHKKLRAMLVACWITFLASSAAWSTLPTHVVPRTKCTNPTVSFLSKPHASKSQIPKSSTTALFGGIGIANNYSWKEEQFEIEVTISNIPPGTTTKDIKFECSSTGIDLRLLNAEKVLLDGGRKMRGIISVDGTFWSISDAPLDKTKNQQEKLPPLNSNPSQSRPREITINIEKHFTPTSTAQGTQTYDTLTDFDWGGLYSNDEEEVTYRKYDEAEELNVREYAAKLGVDIDNFDMSKVDKTMFGAGLMDHGKGGGRDNGFIPGVAGTTGATTNDGAERREGATKDGFHFNITKATLEQLTRAGLAKEIVQQGDGTEYELDEDKGEFSMLGKGISREELREAGIGGTGVPDMWQQSVPVEEVPGFQTIDFQRTQEGGFIEDEVEEKEIRVENSSVESDKPLENASQNVLEVCSPKDSDPYYEAKAAGNEGDHGDDDGKHIDPIDELTVAKLKEILRAQGLKISGTKRVLRDRLREHVNSLLEEEK